MDACNNICSFMKIFNTISISNEFNALSFRGYKICWQWRCQVINVFQWNTHFHFTAFTNYYFFHCSIYYNLYNINLYNIMNFINIVVDFFSIFTCYKSLAILSKINLLLLVSSVSFKSTIQFFVSCFFWLF